MIPGKLFAVGLGRLELGSLVRMWLINIVNPPTSWKSLPGRISVGDAEKFALSYLGHYVIRSLVQCTT